MSGGLTGWQATWQTEAMTTTGTVENLTGEQRDAMLRFLLHHMDLDLRGILMAEQPVAYVKLYPDARDAVLRRVATATEQ